MDRFLISRKNTGLGSDLATVVGAWDYARRTSRTLVIDWRNSLYLQDRSLNAFPRLFQKIDHIEGVRVICDDSITKQRFPTPTFPLQSLGHHEYRDLILHRKDMDAPTLLNRLPMHSFPSVELQRKVLSALRLHDEVQSQVNEFIRDEFASATVLGVHFRHGNGEHLGFGRDSDTLDRCQQFAVACREMYKNLKNTSHRHFRIFLATDSQEVVHHLTSLISSVFTRPKRFHELNGGRLHRRSLGLSGAQDALIEMSLLAQCNALIYNSSWFSYYARLLGQFDLAPVNLTPNRNYATI